MTEATTQAASPVTEAAPVTEAVTPAVEAAAVVAEASAPAADAAKTESTPSLLSAAEGKPKAEATAEAKPAEEKPAPAEEAKPAEPKAETKDSPKEEPKAKEPAKDDASKVPDPAKTADAALQPPVMATIEDLNLPADIKLGEKESKAFLDIVNDGKLDAKARGKALTELYVSEAKRIAEATAQHQMDVWLKYNEKEKADFRADPEVGGNRAETTLTLGKAVIERYMPEERRERFLKVLDHTGLGNNRDMIWLMNKFGELLSLDKAEDGMVAARAKAPVVKGPGNRGWYQDMPDRKAS